MDGADELNVQLLGAVVVVRGHPINIGGPTQRRILAVLAAHAGEVVSVDRLIEITWPDDATPEHAQQNIRSYISRIRSGVGELSQPLIESQAPGYVLRVEPDSVDMTRFSALADEAPSALERGEYGLTTQLAHSALQLWKQPPYGEFTDEAWCAADVTRLNEQHQRLTETLALSHLRSGRANEAVLAIEESLRRHPFREAPRDIHMRALHLAGRQVDALRSFQEFRCHLVEELGVEPTQDLVELDRLISADSPSLRVLAGATVAIPGYEVLEQIGEGAFAEVYRGVQPSLQRNVAIKAIRSEFANRADFIRAFEAEAGTVATLEHPHIVPLYDFWREPNRAFLVMRWLPGGNLESALDFGPLSIEHVASIVEQIGSALSAAHRSGVIHRDVKPANILLDDLGNAYLTDFGIALEAQTRADDPRAALSHGTPAYAPPEQLRREVVGPYSDLYSFAVLIYELLAGTAPFEGLTEPEILHAQLNAEFPAIAAQRSDVPARLNEVLRRATQKDPKARYGSVDELVNAFALAIADDKEAQPALHAFKSRVTSAPGPIENPYVGLRAFEEFDATRFQGRARLVDELLEKLGSGATTSRLLALIGPSGSGKSSVVRAGLLPALRNGGVQGSQEWFITTMRPGTDPYESLETALLRVAVNPPTELISQLRSNERGLVRGVRRIVPDDHGTVLLVIDQFEELFTLGTDPETRRKFLAALTAAIVDPQAPLRVILTLRADFYDHPLRFPGFAELVKASGVVITPLAPDELEQAIVAPAAAAGVGFEPGLVAEIIADVAMQPGALPLLQYALRELFDARVASTLTVDAYREIGGIAGALSRRAEELYRTAEPPVQNEVRRLFQRLVTIGENAEDTRRVIRRSELAETELTDDAIALYSDARLLVLDRETSSRELVIDVAHEALIREWPRLRAWLDASRDELRIHRHLTAASDSWLAGGQEESDLYRGSRLDAIADWPVARQAELSSSELDFLERSLEDRTFRETAERETVEHTERQNRSLRRLLFAVGLVATAALLAGLLAFQQRGRANSAAADAAELAASAESRRLAADAAQLVDSNRRLALLLAVEAHRRSPGPASLGALQQALVGDDELLGYIGGGRSYIAVAWAGADHLVAATETQVDLWSTTGELQRSWELDAVTDLAVDSEGAWVAASLEDGVAIWSLTSIAPPQRSDDTSHFQTVAWHPGGEYIAAGSRRGEIVIFGDSSEVLNRFDAHAERNIDDLDLGAAVSPTAQHVPASARRGVLALAFSDDGARLLSGGWGYSRVWHTDSWDLESSGPLVFTVGSEQIVESAEAVAFWDDSSSVTLTIGRFATHTHDAITGEELTYAASASRDNAGARYELTGHAAAAGSGIAVTAPATGAIEITTSATTATEQVVERYLPRVDDIALSNDGRIAAAGLDGLVVISTTGDRLLGRALSAPIGAELAVTDDGRHVILSTPEAGGLQQILHIGTDGVVHIPFQGPTPDFVFGGSGSVAAGIYCAPTCADGQGDYRSELRRIDVETGAVSEPLTMIRSDLRSAIVSANGGPIAIGYGDASVELYDSTTGSTLARLTELQQAAESDGGIRSLALDPTNRYFAATTTRGAAAVWDLESGEVTTLAEGGGQVVVVGFTSDGKQMLTSSAEGVIALRAVPGFQPTGTSFVSDPGSSGTIRTIGFTDDGRYLVSSITSEGRIWELHSQSPIGLPFPTSGPFGASVAANGRYLVGNVGDDTAVLWEIDIDAWPEIACRAAGRNMTAQEWELFGPTESPYNPTCPHYPPA